MGMWGPVLGVIPAVSEEHEEIEPGENLYLYADICVPA
jgi:hypothetical protein